MWRAFTILSNLTSLYVSMGVFLKRIFLFFGFCTTLLVGAQLPVDADTGEDTTDYPLLDGEAWTADTNAQHYFVEADYKDSFEVYARLFGKDKVVPDTLKLPFFVALSKYPELWEKKIEFEGTIMSHTMEARPTFGSVLKKERKRTYKIYLNNRKGKYKGIHLSKLTFNMRVGFFGHELAHLLSYRFRNGAQLVGMGAKYLFSKKYKRQIERETDMETIRRGLGYPLYETKKLILRYKNLDIPREYRRLSRKNYMTDTEVLQSILQLGYGSIATSIPTK